MALILLAILPLHAVLSAPPSYPPLPTALPPAIPRNYTFSDPQQDHIQAANAFIQAGLRRHGCGALRAAVARRPRRTRLRLLLIQCLAQGTPDGSEDSRSRPEEAVEALRRALAVPPARRLGNHIGKEKTSGLIMTLAGGGDDHLGHGVNLPLKAQSRLNFLLEVLFQSQSLFRSSHSSLLAFCFPALPFVFFLFLSLISGL